jgi:glucose uptake protein
MFTPQTFATAFLMMLVSTACYGSWGNLYKVTKGYRFELFSWDFLVGMLAGALTLALTMGSTAHNASSFLPNVRSADLSNIGCAMVGGAIFSLALLFLLAGISLAGLAVSFPVSTGIAVALGVVLAYAFEPKGNPLLLSLGVLFTLIAVILAGRAYASLQHQETRVSRKGLFVCLTSGILMGLFPPFVGRALTAGNVLGPYGIAVFFSLGALLGSCFANVYFMRNPIVGEPVGFTSFLSIPGKSHLAGLLGGLIVGLGVVFNFVAASFTGIAISYAVGQAAPMVAALWGIFLWREFAGSGTEAKVYLTLMFVFYFQALALIARAYSAANT